MCQGRAPFPYALAELVDNSLRATISSRCNERKIIISFVLSAPENPASGLISVWDNGCGMAKKELNEWAIMNLSMEDKSAGSNGDCSEAAQSAAPAAKFLSGNLSYFGVKLSRSICAGATS